MRCTACGWTGDKGLEAPEVVLCPGCRQQALVRVCEVEGCDEQAVNFEFHDGRHQYRCRQHTRGGTDIHMG